MGKYHNTLDLLKENSCYTKIVNSIIDNCVILEFGPAEGVITRYLSDEKKCDVYIVEIDNDAFEKVKPYAKDGILGDIEEYEWEKKFSDIRFDYVIFSDVLEHLRNPEEVLRHVLPLLKDDGKVLCSIPNIAHNDIILRLCMDHFDYTETGLLDTTHVHFFAYNSLEPFFDNAGFAIVKEDYTINKTYHTEQGIKDERCANYLGESFYNRPCGEIYQFIIEAQKKEYVSEAGVEISRPISEMVNNSEPDAINYPLMVQERDEIIEQKENYIQEQRESITDLNIIIEQKENYIQEQREIISEKQAIIEQKENYIQEQRGVISEKNIIIEQKENYIQEQREKIERLNAIIKQKESYIKAQFGKMAQRGARVLQASKNLIKRGKK